MKLELKSFSFYEGNKQTYVVKKIRFRPIFKFSESSYYYYCRKKNELLKIWTNLKFRNFLEKKQGLW